MKSTPPNIEFIEVILTYDRTAPFKKVVKLIETVFSQSQANSDRIARLMYENGYASVGRFPKEVSTALIQAVHDYIKQKNFKVSACTWKELQSSNDEPNLCSFCNKLADEGKSFKGSAGSFICANCLLKNTKKLASTVHGQQFYYAHELLSWHFYNIPSEKIITSARTFPMRMQADLQMAMNRLFNPDAIKFVGIHGGSSMHDPLTMSSLFDNSNSYSTKKIAPLQYEDMDIGEAAPIKCLKNGVWLKKQVDFPYAVLCSPFKDYSGNAGINIETAVAPGEEGQKITQTLFKELERAVNEAYSYRGKVLSLNRDTDYAGTSSGIKVHKISGIDRSGLILPEETLNAIERNIVHFAEKRKSLKELGQSTKKGILFHGPPGTGKTHTIRYLAAALKDHTTFIITAEQIALLSEYFTLARLLQPATMIIEDVDLIAKAREKSNSTCEEALLNKLLNEMDGLNEDADIFFILTTNRPDILEEAIASRPGRVDQSIEFPLPDDDCRRRLVSLYKAGLNINEQLLELIVSKTQGVSASFIKELMRRIAQYNLDNKNSAEVQELDLTNALEEMIFIGGQLNIRLLGGRSSE